MFFEYSFMFLWVMTIEGGAISNRDTSHKSLVNKCCPLNQYVGKRKMCVYSEEIYSFSSIEVYDNYMNKMDKSFDEILTLAPEKFADAFFRSESVDITLLNFRTYVLLVRHSFYLL